MFNAELPISRMIELSRDTGFVREVEALYATLDARIAGRGPTCWNRGDCCKFGTFGHRLFVTPVELAYFFAVTDAVPVGGPMQVCPYQLAGRCGARSGRPSGCRIFFCDPAHQSWQSSETEYVLQEIKRMHAKFDVPYVYVEWLAALEQWHQADGSRSQVLIDTLGTKRYDERPAAGSK